jgi:hypothetical protein
MRVPALGLRGAAIGLAAGDLLCALYVLRESLRLLDDNLQGFLGSILDLAPLFRLGRRLAIAVGNEKS